MNILLCNDDGIFSEGLKSLANILKREHTVTVVAPSGNRSGFSRSISFYKDLTVQKVDAIDGVECYSMSGTPTDCVKFAILTLGIKFDLVVSGINNGSNLGSDIYYSGTVGACFEANFFKIPAIAFSSVQVNADYSVVSKIVEDVLPNLLTKLDGETTLNVNIPSTKKGYNGVKYCFVGINKYSDGYMKVNEDVYQLVGKPIPPTESDFGSDVYYSYKGFVTISPLKNVLTDHSTLSEFNK